MKSLVVTLPDGSQRQYEKAITPREIAKEIGKRLEEAALAAKVNDRQVDLNFEITDNSNLAIITRDSKEGLEILRHSCAHLLAQAVKELYPGTQITIGPVIEDGFYYDIDCPKAITNEDLPAIEKRMHEIAARKLEVTRREFPRAEAIQFFKNLGENYKVELIESFASEDSISAYAQGDFVDLCRGPHIPNTQRTGKFKLTSVAGAYWRGDEKNKMLQRIYGTCFATQKELDEHLKRIEEAKKRDHRRLGPELGLFTFLPIAPAMPFYLPKGALLVNLLTDYMRKHIQAEGYQEVICPQLMTTQLWATSGHLENFKENMFFVEPDEGQVMALKPMNCPGHASLFATTKHSYRELPVRFAEFSKLHRNERAGVTHGLLRTRTFSQDDGHIFCTDEQIGQEALAMIRLLYKVYAEFGFNEVEVKLATRPEKYLGTIETWDQATRALEDSLKSAQKSFTYAPGEGAFYGPKIEFHIKDSLGRTWQCGTIQIDYSFPHRFQLEYIDSESKPQRPVMIHRAILGSVERFMGILIEHHAGHLPLWISPLQAVVINVSEAQREYAQTVTSRLQGLGLRVEADLRNEKLGYKIREAQLKKTPLMLILGQKEVDHQMLSVRKASGETVNDLTMDGFKKFLEPQLNPGGTNH